jgi:hypothetical protein
VPARRPPRVAAVKPADDVSRLRRSSTTEALRAWARSDGDAGAALTAAR